jgi:hypothetical protein
MFPEALREMKEPKRWPAVMTWTYAVMVPCYLVCMCLGEEGGATWLLPVKVAVSRAGAVAVA